MARKILLNTYAHVFYGEEKFAVFVNEYFVYDYKRT
jgi:hypothetical protein